MAFSRQQIIALYRQRAGAYDLTANLYYLLGFREQAYRRQAVACLNLAPGDMVIEIGCGTGLNFGLLLKKIGPNGRLIGVDLSESMLAQAQNRCQRYGWSNVELVRQDAEEFCFPKGVNAVLSTFALTLVPGFDQVVARAAAALEPGGRLAVLDLKMPPSFPNPLVWLFLRITRPFGVTLDLAARHPWESLGHWLYMVFYREYYFGLAYIAVGEKEESGDSVLEAEGRS